MKTYCGYTEEEIKEMESKGTLPSYVLVDYLNDDYDNRDE